MFEPEHVECAQHHVIETLRSVRRAIDRASKETTGQWSPRGPHHPMIGRHPVNGRQRQKTERTRRMHRPNGRATGAQ